MRAIALHSIVPVRTEPREGAEQETQMLFGELCRIEETNVPGAMPGGTKGNWYKIRLESDGAEGWADAKMLSPIGGKDYTAYRQALENAACVAMPMAYAVSENNGQTLPLTAGTRLTNYKDGRFEVLGVGFRIDPGMVRTQPAELNMQTLLETVRFFLNVPYLWGGKNALGMDCSGFSQIVMSLFGRRLKRNASQQALQGRPVGSLKRAQAGDLVFFAKTEPSPGVPVTHVGIVIDSGRVIHCSGRVKVEKLDERGIFNAETGGYSHYLCGIRRV